MFTVIFAVFLVVFKDSKLNRTMQEKTKNIERSAKNHQKYANLCKNKPLFHLENTYFAKNPVKIAVSNYESAQ